MAKKNETVKLRVREFYDGGLIQLNNITVPSKRVGYKKQDGILIAKVPLGVPQFEEAIKEIFSELENDWPLKGRLLVGIAIHLPKKDYKVKDVDNMAKAILDAFCGIAYEDDKQIDCLYVSKDIAEEWSVWIALKTLGNDSKSWFIEPMLTTVSEDEG